MCAKLGQSYFISSVVIYETQVLVSPTSSPHLYGGLHAFDTRPTLLLPVQALRNRFTETASARKFYSQPSAIIASFNVSEAL